MAHNFENILIIQSLLSIFRVYFFLYLYIMDLYWGKWSRWSIDCSRFHLEDRFSNYGIDIFGMGKLSGRLSIRHLISEGWKS